MNIKILINKTFRIILLITLCTFLIVWCVYFLYGISDPVEKTLSITVGFFSSFSTLGAAYIAANLFNDWKSHQRYLNKKDFSKSLKTLIYRVDKAIYNYRDKLADIRIIDKTEISLEELVVFMNSHDELIDTISNLDALMNEANIYFRNDINLFTDMQRYLEELKQATDNIHPLISHNKNMQAKYLEETIRLEKLGLNLIKHYKENILNIIHNDLII